MKTSVTLSIIFAGILCAVFLGPANGQDMDSKTGFYKTRSGPYGVSSIKLIELYDDSQNKTLQLRISYPASGGPFPVIVWSHGATGTKDMYEPLITHWTSHGYVCVQPNHSDSRAFGKKEQTEVLKDWASRPRDISFILDSLKALEEQYHSLAGKMDTQHLGVGGHSFGAHTAQLTGGVTTVNPRSGRRTSHTDPRPSAFILLSPQGKGGMLDEASWDRLTRPALVITGSKDPGRNREPYTWRLDPFKYAPPGSKYLLFIEGARHGFGGIVGGERYSNAGPKNTAHMNYVKSATTAFWDAYLKHDSSAERFLHSGNTAKQSGGEAQIEFKDDVSQAPNLSTGTETCTAAMADEDWFDSGRSRTVPVRIYAPELRHGKGPFPLIVFSHGGGESRASFSYLGRYWAERGYIAVFITHPGHDRTSLEKNIRAGKNWHSAMGSPEDFPDRTSDFSFVLDYLLSAELSSPLVKGRFNPDLICAAGQCAGSTTALAMAGLTADLPGNSGAEFRDPRVKIVMALSPQTAARAGKTGLQPDSWSHIVTPALVITGTKDFTWLPAVKENPSLRRKAFDSMPPGDKYLVEIKGAEHHAFTDSVPFYPAGKRDPRHRGWIQLATTAFLDAYLKKDDTALSRLQNEELESQTGSECLQEYRPYDFSSVDAYIEKSLPRIGGGCALILIRGNRVIYRKAYGDFTPDKVVPIASASKWISGGVIMSLVDAGKISLDDTAGRYLDGFSGEKSNITIRQMFSHTSGFPNSPAHHHNTSLTMREAVELTTQVNLAAEPGTALFYGGLGMQVAGRICEIAAQKSWVDIFQERLAGPLNMDKTTYYAFGRTRNPNVAGSVETCIDDYGSYLMMLLNQGLYQGKRILSEEAVRTMLTNQSGNHVDILRHPYIPYSDLDPALEKAPYGIGCWLERIDPETGRGWEISSGGAYGCMPFIDVKRNLAGVYLPYSRNLKKDEQGNIYNDTARVYFELKPTLAAAIDGKTVPVFQSEPPAAGREIASERSPQQRASLIIRALDKNKDGQLSRSEAPQRLIRVFSRIDRNNNRKLSVSELAELLERINRFQSIQSPRRRQSSQRESSDQPGLHTVAAVDLFTLPDPARNKSLQLRITYPESEGCFPLIVFSHYVGGSRRDYKPLTEDWAKHGYIIIQADHSDSRELTNSGPRLDWENRTRDMSFILDSIETIESGIPAIRGKIDTNRIGAGGHLIGAYAACILAGQKNFNPGAAQDLKDPRVKAVLLLSPQGRGQGLTDASWEDISIPMMVLTGSGIPSRRTNNPAEWRQEPFRFSRAGDKYLVWMEGLDSTYSGLIDGRNIAAKEALWIKEAVRSFWDGFLKEDTAASSFLVSKQLEEESGGRITISIR